EQGGKAVQQVVALLGELAAVDHDGVGHPVVDEHPALAVEDAAARRLGGDKAHPVALGLDAVARGREDLEVPEADEQCREQRHDDHAHDAQPEARRLQGHAKACSSAPDTDQPTRRRAIGARTPFVPPTTAATFSRLRSTRWGWPTTVATSA